MFVSHLCVFFGEMSVLVFSPLFDWGVSFSGVTFMSIIYIEFVFLYGVKKCSNFILLHVAVQFSQPNLLKRLSLPQCIFLSSLS